MAGTYASYPFKGGGGGLQQGFYGDGSDGAAVLDGVNTYAWVSLSGSTYTLLQTVYLSSLSISAAKILLVGPYFVFVSGTLTNAGTIRNDGPAGGAASGITGGAPGLAANASPLSTNFAGEPLAGNTGGTGPSGNTDPGTNGANGSSGSAGGILILTGAGGNGGAGTSGAGGTGGTVATTTGASTFRHLSNVLLVGVTGIGSTIYGGINASPSGASGSGDGVESGGGGGAGGSNGGVIGLWAFVFNNTGTITAIGGAGGAGGMAPAGNCGGGGGGGGGAGGFIYIVSNTYTATGTITVAGGAAGAAGLKHGTGVNGSTGTAGAAGLILKYNGTTGAWL